jgi:hypothetical protein
MPGCGRQVAAIPNSVFFIWCLFFFRIVMYFYCNVLLLLCWWRDVGVAASCLTGTIMSRHNQETGLSGMKIFLRRFS